MSMYCLPDNHPRKERVIAIQDLARRHKPPTAKPGFVFKEPLTRGWMLPYLLQLEGMIWGRWAHWNEIVEAGKMLGPIPQIAWIRDPLGRKEIERNLSAITRMGDWAGWSSWTYFDYFLDWLLFGFGHAEEAPKEPAGCDGASERLYQTFNLGPVLAFPHDYFGDILAENQFGRRSGFYPTPLHLCQTMVEMQMHDEGAAAGDCRDKTVCDPCLGTGRMLLAASNHSYRLHGMDINGTVIKAALANGYLYAPWLVKPFNFWPKKDEAQIPAEISKPQQEPQEFKPQLELVLA